MTLFVFIFPHFWKWPYTERDKTALSQAPSWEHPFGTDDLGHDYFAQRHAGRPEVASRSPSSSSLLGHGHRRVVGAFSGYFRGWTERVLMRFTDLMLTIPALVIAAVLGRISGGGYRWLLSSGAVGLVLWTTLARIVRGEFLSLREKEFVEAARAIGASDRRIIFRHILPNVLGHDHRRPPPSTIADGHPPRDGAELPRLRRAVARHVARASSSATTRRPSRPARGCSGSRACSSSSSRCRVNFIGDGLRDAFDPKQTGCRRQQRLE